MSVPQLLSDNFAVGSIEGTKHLSAPRAQNETASLASRLLIGTDSRLLFFDPRNGAVQVLHEGQVSFCTSNQAKEFEVEFASPSKVSFEVLVALKMQGAGWGVGRDINLPVCGSAGCK